MNHLYSNYTLSYRICASILIILHLIAFGPIKDALAFTAQSQSYRLSIGALNEGGTGRANVSSKLWQDSLGEPAIGKAGSASYSLNAGLIAILQTNHPLLIQPITYQSWLMDTVKATDPITNNYSQTYFYQGRSGQDGALKGQIEKIISYDGNGKRISQTLNTSEVAEGLLGGGVGYTVQREYDLLDRLTTLTYPDGEVVNYGYDSNSGLLETVNGTRSAVNVEYVSNVDYNAQGQIKTMRKGLSPNNGLLTSAHFMK